MLNSTRQTLSDTDYVTMVRSVYADSQTMIYGGLAAAIGALVSGLHTGSVVLFGFAIAFLVVGVARYLDMRAFRQKDLAPADKAEAWHWEIRSIIGGGVFAGLNGAWCLFAFAGLHDSFAQLTATTLSVGTFIGIAGRNFGLSRLVLIQTLLIAIPLAGGLVLEGNIYYVLLGLILIPLFASMYRVAGTVRRLLLSAMHGRVDATKLAEELDSALSTMPLGLFMIDREGQVLVINDRAREMLEIADDADVVGRPAAGLIFFAMSRNILTKATAHLLIAELSAGDDNKLIIDLAGDRHCEVTSCTRNDHTVLMLEDISDRVLAETRLNAMARYDSLSQLPNRSFFSEQVSARLSEFAAWDQPAPVMVIMIDIDDFKHVNDTLGHPAGDRLIHQVAERLSGLFGQSSLVSRFGGDEFIIFRTGEVSQTIAEEDAAAISAALRVPFDLGIDEGMVTASIGIVLVDGARTNLEDVLTRADLALHNAKAHGKACWSVFQDEMDTEYRQRQQLKTQLHSAIEKGQLFVTYQPIVDIRTRQLVGCEALIRWRHPELGIISPTVFIPLAEETGDITNLSRFVLAAACRECLNWPDHMSVSVNLSATDFRTTSVEQMIAEVIETVGLPSERLIVEITETALIEEPEKVSHALANMRGMGVGTALDDFGTGYSSLGYLTTMSFSKIKIDRSFTRDIASDERALRLLRSVARLSDDLDMTVTVEGVETEEQLQVIIDATSIQHAQGYLFGPPLAARDIGELIQRMTHGTDERVALPDSVAKQALT